MSDQTQSKRFVSPNQLKHSRRSILTSGRMPATTTKSGGVSSSFTQRLLNTLCAQSTRTQLTRSPGLVRCLAVGIVLLACATTAMENETRKAAVFHRNAGPTRAEWRSERGERSRYNHSPSQSRAGSFKALSLKDLDLNDDTQAHGNASA